MSALPLIVFIGSAGLLFGTSHILVDADPAMRGRQRRFILQAVVSLFVLGAALLLLFTRRFDPNIRCWAFGSVGMVVGYWLNSK
jgi:hypothetical protein